MPAEVPTVGPFDKSVLSEDSPLPLYLQLARHLRRLMLDGHLEALGALPSERSLAESFGVSRVTVRKALHELSNEGLLSQRQGAGTFINPAPRVEQRLSTLTSFTEDMESRGLSAGSRWLEYTVSAAAPEEALALDLSPGATVSRLCRQRLADGLPVAIEVAVVPTRFLPNPSEVTGSLYAKLRALGFPPYRALQRLRAVKLPAELAPLLDAKEGDAALYIERRTLLENGCPIEFVRSHYRGDIYDFLVELGLTGWGRRE